MKIKCIIVDDEPGARNGLAEDIKEIDYLEVCGLAANAFEALDLINRFSPALCFLDIDMPGINGLDFIRLIKLKPMIILTTAYEQYALNAYELGVVDYLLKPILIERLKIACDKAMELYAYRNMPTQKKPEYDFFYIKCNGIIEKINFSEILYIEAANNYVLIHTPTKKFISYHTLKSMETQLPKDQFVRVHKSFIVSKMHIEQITKNKLSIHGIKIPLSRNFKTGFQKDIIIKKLF